jgi:hypothetical protein
MIYLLSYATALCVSYGKVHQKAYGEVGMTVIS